MGDSLTQMCKCADVQMFNCANMHRCGGSGNLAFLASRLVDAHLRQLNVQCCKVKKVENTKGH